MKLFSPRSAALALLLVCWFVPAPLEAANQIEFFFPDAGNPNNPGDDGVVVKPIFWDSASEPIFWYVYRPSGSFSDNHRALDPIANLPPFGFGPFDDFDVLDAVSRALAEWNGNPFAGIEYDENPLFTDQILSLPNQPFHPFDPALDGFNLISFRTTLDFPDGVIAVTSASFMAKDFDASEFLGIPLEDLDFFGSILIPLNNDGEADVLLQARDYAEGEIIDSDIMFNPALAYRLWPKKKNDISDEDMPFIFGSFDIQAIATHELGHSRGLGHTYLLEPTMTPTLFLNSDPYDMRSIEYDDQLAEGLLYKHGLSGSTEIRGSLLDYGRLNTEDPPTVDPPADSFNGVFAPIVRGAVFLGRLAGPSEDLGLDGFFTFVDFHDGNPKSLEFGKFIAEVLTGQNLRSDFINDAGLILFTPSGGVTPSTFNPGSGDQSTDLIGNISGLNAEFDSQFRFRGLEGRNDYILWTSPTYLVDTNGDPIYNAVSNVYDYFLQTESWFPEFYNDIFNLIDSESEDLDHIPTSPDPEDDILGYFTASLIQVDSGQLSNGRDIRTNVIDPANPPAETTVFTSPPKSPAATTLTVEVYGQGFLHGASVSFGPGITVNWVNVITSSHLQAGVSISQGASIGKRGIVAMNPNSTTPHTGAFTVLAPVMGVDHGAAWEKYD